MASGWPSPVIAKAGKIRSSRCAQTVEKPGVRKLSDIKLLKEDAEGVERDAEDIKARYAKIFRV